MSDILLVSGNKLMLQYYRINFTRYYQTLECLSAEQCTLYNNVHH